MLILHTGIKPENTCLGTLGPLVFVVDFRLEKNMNLVSQFLPSLVHSDFGEEDLNVKTLQTTDDDGCTQSDDNA